MEKIIAITNQKGGVGKTTTAINLAASFGKLGKRTLLIDMDPQGNTTSGLGIDKRKLTSSVYDVLLNIDKINQAIVSTKFDNLHILPSNMALAGAEIELAGLENRESKLSQAVNLIKHQYDYIFVDCPPSLGLVTTNALCLSDSVIVPIQCEFYALEGLSQLMSTVRRIKRTYNPRLDVEGVLLTMVDGRLRLTQQVSQEIKKYFSDKVFETVIPRTVKLSESPGFGVPVIYYDRYNKGARAYLTLAEDILKNHGRESEAK